MKRLFLVLITIMLLTSCVAVKEYEKVNLNDPDMALTKKNSDRFITNFHIYREAAAGANGGKSGGGCGCN